MAEQRTGRAYEAIPWVLFGVALALMAALVVLFDCWWPH